MADIREIKFGTSGWRGIISDDLTFDNVRLVTQAVAEYVKKTCRKDPVVIVGYDTRFLSEDFALESSRVLAGNRIKVLLCKRDTPTPVIAYEIIRRKTSGAINFTASHNPYQYNGLKFSPSSGGPAPKEATRAIEDCCRRLLGLTDTKRDREIKDMDPGQAKKKGIIKMIDPAPAYLKRVEELVDFRTIRRSGLRIVADLLYGTCRGYLDTLLRKAGCNIHVLHDYRDVLFGGHQPEPSAEYLPDAIRLIKRGGFHLGLSADGDSDRFGIIDRDGTFISPNHVIALLLYHLVRERGYRGVVARSVMTSSFIDAVAGMYDIPVREKPVGFKYIAQVMAEEDMIIGGEESGGLTIKGHVPEKDGILACLLIAEMVAKRKRSIKQILDELYRKVGPYHTERLNFHLAPAKMAALRDRLNRSLPDRVGGIEVKRAVTIDGYKFIFKDNSWLGIRLSGTEPVVRLYIEAPSLKKVRILEKAGKSLLA